MKHRHRTIKLVCIAVSRGSTSVVKASLFPRVQSQFHSLGLDTSFDPDDYRWEVAYNPFFSFDESGNLKLD